MNDLLVVKVKDDINVKPDVKRYGYKIVTEVIEKYWLQMKD